MELKEIMPPSDPPAYLLLTSYENQTLLV
jgi:hypothetical protein